MFGSFALSLTPPLPWLSLAVELVALQVFILDQRCELRDCSELKKLKREQAKQREAEQAAEDKRNKEAQEANAVEAAAKAAEVS